VPSQIIEKAIFVSIPVLAGIGIHQLLDWLRGRFVPPAKKMLWAPALYVGGLLYVVNPFTYERFMAGQYGVLLGYALLPFIVRLLLEFADNPTRRRAIKATLLAVLMSILSLPTIGEVVLLTVCIMAAAAWQQRKNHVMLGVYTKNMGLGILAFCILGSYWLVPAISGNGAIATQLATFTTAHAEAFATVGGNILAKFMAVLRLQGFWAEPHQLFMLPQDHTPAWGTIRLVIWAGVITGAVLYWRGAKRLAATFTVAGLASAFIAVGAGSGLLTHLGYREPQKFVGVLALVFAVFITAGAARVFAWAQTRSDTAYALTAGAAIFLVLLWTSTMYWGFAAQLRPRQYPEDWARANSYLTVHNGEYTTVFVPWHQYMSFDFAGRIIATPATHYFDRPVITSNDPELGAITPPEHAQATRIGNAIKPTGDTRQLRAQLYNANVRYILLAKDFDFQKYAYLDHQPNLQRVLNLPKVSIYENKDWKGKQ